MILDQESRVFLEDMRTYAIYGLAFVEGVSLAQFEENREKQFAVIRAIEIIGEAAAKIPAPLRSQFPHIPWREIVATRNKFVHHYFGPQLERIWRVTQDELPQLVDHLNIILNDISSEDLPTE